MAGSCKPGPLNPPIDSGLIPARTPGPLGMFDQGDPGLTTLLGDTPGPLGFNDWASADLPRLGSMFRPLSGPLCRLADGTAVSFGSSIPSSVTQTSQAALITVSLLKVAESSNSEEYYKSIVNNLNVYAKAYSVNSPLRIAHFLAQIGHESHFKIAEENGSYSAKRMREIFGCKGGSEKYNAASDDATAGRLRPKLWDEEAKYANNPKNLLSYAYASRLGNGDELSGDGYKYRGRGMMQLTGKTNYSEFTNTHNQKNPNDQRDFVANPELVAIEIAYGIESSFYFWNSRNLNVVADTDDVEQVTTLVNSGLNGLADRKARLAKLKQELGI